MGASLVKQVVEEMISGYGKVVVMEGGEGNGLWL